MLTLQTPDGEDVDAPHGQFLLGGPLAILAVAGDFDFVGHD